MLAYFSVKKLVDRMTSAFVLQCGRFLGGKRSLVVLGRGEVRSNDLILTNHFEETHLLLFIYRYHFFDKKSI